MASSPCCKSWSEVIYTLVKKFDHNQNAVALRKSYRPFMVEDRQVGLVRPDVVEHISRFPHAFVVGRDRVELHPRLKTYEERSACVDHVLQELRKQKCLKTLSGWRNECYEVRPAFEDTPLMKMDRCATCLFGIRQYGVDINGYVRKGRRRRGSKGEDDGEGRGVEGEEGAEQGEEEEDEDGGVAVWIQRRAYNKQTWPGRLDSMVSGGIAVGYDIMDTVHKEAEEEASILPHLLQRMEPAGAVTFYFEDDRGLFLETEYVFDLELPVDFIPRNADGEVDEFQLVSIKELKEKMVSNEFKTTSVPATLDFLVRHGFINPKNEPHYNYLVEKIHLPLQSLFSASSNNGPSETGSRIRSPSRPPGNQEPPNL